MVLQDLRGIVAREPLVRDVGVFYGAGHMMDMERRLVEEMGYLPEATEWATAIRVDPRETGLAPEQLKIMRKMFRSMFEKAQVGGKTPEGK